MKGTCLVLKNSGSKLPPVQIVPIYTLSPIAQGELFLLSLANKMCYQVSRFLPKLSYFNFILWLVFY